MSKKEEKAKEYALSIAETDKQWGAPLNKEQTSIITSAFKSGWDEALRNQWISVKEKLPPRYVKVFVLLEYEGSIQIHTYQYCGEHRWHFADAKIIAWMPIPSFDEILEINKDVLKRLKDK